MANRTRLAAAIAAMVACAQSSPMNRQQPTPLGETAMRMALDTKGDGRPLVLIGGGLTGWQSWIPHQERLAATRKVIRAQPVNVQFGLDGHPLPADYSVKLESRALASALDDAGITDPVDLVAWSYGALVTLDYALDHPGRVRTLTLIEPPGFWILEGAGALDDRSRRERDDMKALHEQMQGDVTEEQLAEFLRQAGFAADGTAVRSLPPWPNWVKHRRSLLQGPAVFAHRDDVARLRSFHRPVLLFKGTGSSYFLHRVIDVLSATLPEARVVELPGGHAPQMAAMEEFLRLIVEFTDDEE